MQDIADAAGVSKATVSLVLNGKSGKRVSETVRKKVEDTARGMGYRINDLARSLRTGRTNLISILMTDISDDFFGRMASHLQEEAMKHGYTAVISNTGESAVEFSAIVSVITAKKVDGTIAVPPQGSGAALETVLEHKTPIVQIDRHIEGLDAPYVETDNYDITCMALKELISCGRRKIVMISPDIDVNAISERERAFRDTLSAEGNYREDLVRKTGLDDRKEVKTILADLMDQDTEAIFFASKRTFTLAMENLPDCWRAKDITFLCFGEARSYKALLGDRLWYIEQPLEAMARKAFSLLLSKMKGEDTDMESVIRSSLSRQSIN